MLAVGTHRLVLGPNTVRNTRRDGVEVRQVRVPLLQLIDEIRELRDRVLHVHVLVPHPRAQADRSLLLADSRDDGIHDLEREPRTVLDRATVLVRALVRDVLEELIDEVPRGTVNLHAVKACTLYRILGRSRVPLDVLFDLCRISWCINARRRV